MKFKVLFLCFLFICLSVKADVLDEKQRLLRQTILYQTGSNYFKNVYYAGSKILRWNKSEFPIKVYVDNNLKVPNYYAYAFIKAAAIWQTELPEVIKITFVTDEEKADICFKVTNKKPMIRASKEEETEILAYTEPVVKGDKLLKMYIYIYERNRENKFYKPYEILNISIHEFGHALGISGHSNDKASIMYALYSPETEKKSAFINRQDKNTMTLLYKVAPDITNGDKTKETGNIKAEILAGSMDERVDISIKNEVDELKIKPGDCISRIKVAALYEQKKDYEMMFKYLKEAEPLAKTKDELYAVHIGFAGYYYNKKDKLNAQFHINKALAAKDDKGAREFKTFIDRLK